MPLPMSRPFRRSLTRVSPSSSTPVPSDARPKRIPAAPRPASPGDPLRRLEGLETAYRVTYRRFSEIVTEDHDDREALRTLLSAQGANLTVGRIETTDLGGRTKAVLLDTIS